MAIDNIARGLAASALKKGGITPEQLEEGLAKKLDKVGGTITGDLAIQGDLTVAGTTKSEKTKTLMVEDNVIVTNANKVALQALLSGLAINKDANATYGIMYDPADDTVKFGQGVLDKNGKFTFNAGEGQPIAIRAQAGDFTDAHLVKWNADKNMFEDAGTGIDGLAQLAEQNTFTALNTFTEATQFDKGIESDGDVIITNGVVKVLDSTEVGGVQKDVVTQYNADRIAVEEDGSSYTYTFPKGSGEIALDKFQFSEFTSTEVPGSKEDAWKITDDEASAAIYMENGTSLAGVNVSKEHVGIQAVDMTEATKSAAVIAMDTSSISIGVQGADESAQTYLLIEKDSAKINGKAVATSDDIAKINSDLAGKVNVLPESVVNEVYARTEAGVDSGIAYSYAAEGDTIAKRSSAGTLAVADPTQEGDATNKLYTDRTFIAKSSSKNIIYATDGSSNQRVLGYTQSPSSGGIPQYTSNSTLKTGEPKTDTDAATKKYVDEHSPSKTTINVSTSLMEG